MSEKTEEYFTLKSGRFQYFMVVTTIYDNLRQPISYGLDIGGKLKGCMTITIENPNIIPEVIKARYTPLELENYLKEKTIAHISWIGYNEKCSIKGDLLKAEGTRHMIRTGMRQVQKRYPWVTCFKLEDASQIDCKEGLTISLFELSIMTNNKSYYEKYFGAYLKSGVARELYAKLLSAMVLQNSKQELSFRQFVLESGLQGDTFKLTECEEFYDKSKTFLEFFKALREAKGKYYCEYVYLWGQQFISKYILKEVRFATQHWLIDVNSIEKINVKDLEWTNANAEDISRINTVREDMRKTFEMYGGYSIGKYAKMEV